MNAYAAALASFVLLHVGVSATGLRSVLVARIGEGPFRGLFSLASAAALIWLVWSFGAVREHSADPLVTHLWDVPAWGRYAAQGLMLLSFLLIVPGLITPSPTLVGAEGQLTKDEPAKGILRITRHPFLWGVALWAVAHLFANGERYSVMLFGALGLMVLFGTRSIDRKGAARNPEAWAKFVAVTSNVPFAAILQGRNKLVLGEMGWRLLVALAAYGAVAYFHGFLIGRPAVP